MNRSFPNLFVSVLCQLLVWGTALVGTGVFAQYDSTQYVSKKMNDSLTRSASMTLTTVTSASLIQRDSVFYSRMKTKMYKHRLTRELYDALVQDVYNSQVRTGEVSQIEVNPFLPFEGRIIGDIYFRRLGVFGQTVYDTLRKPGNWFERVGNQLHTNTRENIIRRSYLLFKEGDAINPTVLRDNERLLRTTSIFHDARILVLPREGSRQFVDVYVITQDVWSLLPTGGVGALNQFSVGFEQKNFRGLGHQLFAQVAYSGNDPRQKVEYQGRYTVPFIGKTFLTAQAELLYLRDLKQGSLRLFRPFLTPDTKYAGSLELNHTQVNNRLVARNDSILQVPLSYNYSDIWIGRSFRLFYKEHDSDAKGRSRLIIGLRNTNYEFVRRPTVTADTNQLYQNSHTTLFSIGFSRRKYVRDVLIYGFGRTEDVPVGEAISTVIGIDNAELGPRVYTAFNFSQGKYINRFGYVYGLASIGGYMRKNGGIEQGIMSLESNFFSPLMTTRWGNMRHFLNSRISVGINRFSNEYITLNSSGTGLNTDGIGLNNDALRGTKRWLINYENILFSKLNVIGFRIAFITFANLGLVSFPDRSLLAGPIYQGYGIGFRLRNENLTFNSFQIRLTYYPNIPNNREPFRTGFEGIPVLRFRDFDLSAPQLIQYR